jgi:hypothetical protein
MLNPPRELENVRPPQCQTLPSPYTNLVGISSRYASRRELGDPCGGRRRIQRRSFCGQSFSSLPSISGSVRTTRLHRQAPCRHRQPIDASAKRRRSGSPRCGSGTWMTFFSIPIDRIPHTPPPWVPSRLGEGLQRRANAFHTISMLSSPRLCSRLPGRRGRPCSTLRYGVYRPSTGSL